MDSSHEIRAALEQARAGTEALLAPLPDEELVQQISPLQSPLVWDFAHIAYFEELWLLRSVDGRPPLHEVHDDVYDAFRHARSERAELPILRPDAARAYATDVRAQVLDLLERVDLDGGASPLLHNGFVFGLVVQHELQHQETLLQTLQLRTGAEYPLPEEPAPAPGPAPAAEVEVPGGVFTLGATQEPWAYDNEREPHEVELPPFVIDASPVSNDAFAEFIADGGYDDERLWSSEGWESRSRDGLEAPLYWTRADGGWQRTRFGRQEPVPREEPVQHVCFHEAEAFARWAGKRLPSEAEWERAAAWSGRTEKNRYPWGSEYSGGEANLGHRRLGPVPIGSYSAGGSPAGCLQMTGDVWEWTSSFFQPYPGFVAFPYAEYSEVFYGEEYRVLRGGSWATDPLVARASFRNWDYPIRRQIFTGFRCARDAS